MTNLLMETIQRLERHGLKESDVKWVGTLKLKTTWNNFKEIADVEYDGGYGAQKVASNLLIVGSNWWLERDEYDGSEGWVFKRMMPEPTRQKTLKALTTDQAESLGITTSCGWEDLETINGLK